MKMDRDLNPNGIGKYALILWRKFLTLNGAELERAKDALRILSDLGMMDEGIKGTEAEFMVFRLKDKYAQAALKAYALEAFDAADFEWSDAVLEMAERAGPDSPFCKAPD